MAVTHGHLAVVEYLLEHNANIKDHQSQPSGPTHCLLTSAAQNGFLPIVQCLHQHGANINGTKDNFTDSPLAMAVTHGHLAVVEYLLEHKANIRDPRSRPFRRHIFSWIRNTHCLLTIAAQDGHLPIVKCLLERGANVDGEEQRCAPISEAARHGHLDVVQFLLEHEASDKHGLFLQMVKARHRRNHAIQSLYSDESERAALQFIEAIREERYLTENLTDCRFRSPRGAHRILYFEEQATAEILPDRLSCPLIAEIQARERQRILRQCRTTLSEIHQRLIDQSSNSATSDAFAAFGEASNSYEGVWKEGVGVMRKLIKGHLPHGLHEVVSCLQVADAMRLASSNKKVSTEYIYECSREEYVELTIYDPFSFLSRIIPYS
jgi:ankyrin repeat protein